MRESILRVLSVDGCNNVRCLDHAQVRISSGSRHHSENRDLGRIDTVRAYVSFILGGGGNRHEGISGKSRSDFPEPTTSAPPAGRGIWMRTANASSVVVRIEGIYLYRRLFNYLQHLALDAYEDFEVQTHSTSTLSIYSR
jgi:hypothetical protein